MADAAVESGDAGQVEVYAFDDKLVRMRFIRKVYMILSTQLGISTLFIAFCSLHQPTKVFLQQHRYLFWIALVVMLVTLIIIVCCKSVRRVFPWNVIFLAMFTLASSILLGVVCSLHKIEIVLYAAGITFVIVLTLTIFAFQTKLDFTMLGGVLLACAVVLLIFGIVLIFVHTRVMRLVYSCLAAILFSVYLIYDTQMMIGKNHKHSISPDEYIYAALTLYMDVFNIFLAILGIMDNS